MKKTLYILLFTFLLTSCGRDLEQAQKYANIKSEIENQLEQIELITNDQKATYDSVGNIVKGFSRVNELPPNYSELSEIQSKALDVEYEMNKLKSDLEMFSFLCTLLENTNKKLISLRRQKIISMYIKDIQDFKNDIDNFTDGATVEQYLSNYLSKISE